jgi:hypothetical protein
MTRTTSAFGPTLSLVRFARAPNAPPLTAGDTRALLQRTSPRYRTIPGLIRKYFVGNEQGGGGLYEWSSREAADAWFTPQWFEEMTRLYGTRPQLEYWQVTCLVDNQRGEIFFAHEVG